MKVNVQYLTNEQGNKTSVLIPIREWMAYQKEHQRLIQLMKLKSGMKEAIQEIEEVRKGKKKGTTLNEFLNEL